VTEEEKQEKVYEALEKLICIYMEEFDLTYVSMIGVLEVVKNSLVSEAFAENEEDDEGDDEGEGWKIVMDDD